MNEKIVIYPDYETKLDKLNDLVAEDIQVYDKSGIINTEYSVTNSMDVFNNANTIILTQNCIVNGEYNTKKLEQVCTELQDYIKDDTLVIFDTDIPPRTVRKMKKHLDEYELVPDINLAHVSRITNDTIVVAGTNETSLNRTSEIYKNTKENLKTTEHIETVEMIKLLKSSYTDTLTALANQLSILSVALTVDLVQAIDFANLDENINLIYPKPITENDTIRNADKLLKLANEYGETTPLVEAARDANNYAPYQIAYMAEKELFLKHNLSFFEVKVAILGITTDDNLVTESYNPSLVLVDDLVQRDAEIWVHDDKVSEDVIEAHGAKKITLEEAYQCDCIIVMTDTPEYRALDPNKVEKVLVTAMPLFDSEKFKDVELNVVGQYKLKKGETV
jgi:UDP-N-acetyl-D-mannosaminuronate dehydrogenase